MPSTEAIVKHCERRLPKGAVLVIGDEPGRDDETNHTYVIAYERRQLAEAAEVIGRWIEDVEMELTEEGGAALLEQMIALEGA